MGTRMRHFSRSFGSVAKLINMFIEDSKTFRISSWSIWINFKFLFNSFFFFLILQTFIVVNRAKHLFRFSSSKALWVLRPNNAVRRIAAKILTHPFWAFFMVTIILLNCLLLFYTTIKGSYRFPLEYVKDAVHSDLRINVIHSNPFQIDFLDCLSGWIRHKSGSQRISFG